VLAGYDSVRRQPIEPKWQTAPDDAVLIVEGVFLNRPELRGLWSYSVWLDSGDLKPQTAYAKESKPRTTATAIVNNSDPEHPRRNFADSC
jgi:uridine kinase